MNQNKKNIVSTKLSKSSKSSKSKITSNNEAVSLETFTPTPDVNTPDVNTPEVQSKSLLLANLIFIFHCLVVLFILLAPFTNITALFILHITFCFSLIVHWYSNSNVCSLSIMESYLRGDSRENTFTHQFIAPIYEISESEWNYIIWIATIILLGISIYKLYHSETLKIALECYRDNQPEGSKFMHFINCVKPLFVIY